MITTLPTDRKLIPRTKLRKLVTGILGSAILVLPVAAQSPDLTARFSVRDASLRSQPNRFPRRATLYYEGLWGVDLLSVKAMESGELIRFTYRVVDANKAQALNDKKAEPFLIDPQARVKLVIPSLEKVGQLRQSGLPETGKSYWMAFSNKGRLVKQGDRVNVIIGQFRAEGLIVE